MIAKNIKVKGFIGCVRYVMNETCELLEAKGVLADSTESVIKSFAMQRSGREEIKQPPLTVLSVPITMGSIRSSPDWT